MKLWGSRRRLCFSGWLMAALFLLGLNGYQLLALENQKMVGHSPTIKALRANLAQWENVAMRQVWVPDGSRLKALQVRHSDPVTEDPAETPPANMEAPPLEASAITPLPEFKGLIRTMDRRGRQTYWAVLDGRACQAGDRVGDFAVERVSPGGVVLSRAGRQWHLPCPSPNYSEVLGN